MNQKQETAILNRINYLISLNNNEKNTREFIKQFCCPSDFIGEMLGVLNGESIQTSLIEHGNYYVEFEIDHKPIHDENDEDYKYNQFWYTANFEKVIRLYKDIYFIKEDKKLIKKLIKSFTYIKDQIQDLYDSEKEFDENYNKLLNEKIKLGNYEVYGE